MRDDPLVVDLEPQVARLGVTTIEDGPSRRPTVLITDTPRGSAGAVLHASQDWFRAALAAPRPQN